MPRYLFVDVIFPQEVAHQNHGVVGEEEQPTVLAIVVGHVLQRFAPQVAKRFPRRLAHLAQEQHFQAGDALAVINGRLLDADMTLTWSTSATHGSERWPQGMICLPGGGMELHLLRLGEHNLLSRSG